MNKEERLIQIGARIKEKRTALKMSQDVLADKVGYKGKSIISRIEKGEIDLPESKINAIANALGTTSYELATGEEVLTEIFRLTSTDDSDIVKAQNLVTILKSYKLSKDNISFLLEIIQDEEQLTKLRKMYELMGG